MRHSFLTVIGVTASMAAVGQAYYSDWWTNWKGMMNEVMVDCANGPINCGGDGECMTGYACFTSSTGHSVCDDVARYQCLKDCPDGEVLNPLRYCTCISAAERASMFCAEEPEEPAI